MHLDVLLLSRIQFAMTIMFHYLFPPLSIGLGAILVVMEGMYLKTKDRHYEVMAQFWTRVFAVNFAMGVATGIVMEFEFGTNWAAYSRYVGDVFGSALASEGIFAFFLESGFLAVLVFGWHRVSPKFHFFATLMVALGSAFSAIWIVIANSWMQTPAGFHIVMHGMQARAEITDFWAMVFNPSSMYRLVHTMIGSYILGGFFVMSVSAFYLLKHKHQDTARRSFKIGLIFSAVFALGALVSGHENSLMVSRNQPAKLAAFEGLYKTEPQGAPLSLFGVPDSKTETVKYLVGIPGLLSFMVKGDFHAPVTGLDQFPTENRPPVVVPFISYHIMIVLGMYFIGITLLGVFFLWRRTIFRQRWLLRIFVISVVGPYLANEAGWAAAEVGRQPWLVYGILRTSQGLSHAVHAGQVATSIIMFMVIYSLLFAVWAYVLNDKIQHGPDDPNAPHISHGVDSALKVSEEFADNVGLSMTGAHKDVPAENGKK